MLILSRLIRHLLFKISASLGTAVVACTCILNTECAQLQVFAFAAVQAFGKLLCPVYSFSPPIDSYLCFSCSRFGSWTEGAKQEPWPAAWEWVLSQWEHRRGGGGRGGGGASRQAVRQGCLCLQWHQWGWGQWERITIWEGDSEFHPAPSFSFIPLSLHPSHFPQSFWVEPWECM